MGQITPGYDPFKETISQAGTATSRYAVLQNSAFVIYGLLMLGVAYGYNRRLGLAPSAFIAIHALASMMMGLFPDTPDYPGKPAVDSWHNLFSAIAYTALILSILSFSRVARRERAFKGLAFFGLAVIVFNLPLPFVNHFEPFKPLAGFLQRLFTSVSYLWLALASLAVYKNPALPASSQIPTRKGAFV